MTNHAFDAAQAAEAAFADVAKRSFPEDIFTAPALGWGVVGTGIMARQMAQSLALAGRRLTGVCSRSAEAAHAFASSYGVERCYTSVEELCSDPAIQAVYITTPHNTHIHYLRRALTAGRHVLCEKSITLNAEELREARDLAAQRGVVLMDATTIFHMPLWQSLRSRAASGEFGNMNIAQLSFGSFKEYGDLTNRFYNKSLAGGAMLDIGVYALSLMRMFMESAPSEAVSLGTLSATGVDETSGIVCRNPEGQIGVISLSLHSKQPKRAVISFDRCYIEAEGYPRADSATIVWNEDGRREQVKKGEEGYALCYEVSDLERAVAGDMHLRQLIEYSSDVMDIMTEMRRSWGVFYPEEECIQGGGQQ